MKKLLVLTLFFVIVNCSGQKKMLPEKWVPELPKDFKQHDSSYVQTTNIDTTYGIIRYGSPNGIIEGTGMVVSYKTWYMTTMVPSKPLQFLISGKDTIARSFGSIEMGNFMGEHIDGYIKINGKWVKLDCKFELHL